MNLLWAFYSVFWLSTFNWKYSILLYFHNFLNLYNRVLTKKQISGKFYLDLFQLVYFYISVSHRINLFWCCSKMYTFFCIQSPHSQLLCVIKLLFYSKHFWIDTLMFTLDNSVMKNIGTNKICPLQYFFFLYFFLR